MSRVAKCSRLMSSGSFVGVADVEKYRRDRRGLFLVGVLIVRLGWQVLGVPS